MPKEVRELFLFNIRHNHTLIILLLKNQREKGLMMLTMLKFISYHIPKNISNVKGFEENMFP